MYTTWIKLQNKETPNNVLLHKAITVDRPVPFEYVTHPSSVCHHRWLGSW